MHEIPNSGLRIGEVGVGLVVGPTHDLNPPRRNQPTKNSPILRKRIPVGLEVVNLGKHEPILGLSKRKIEMRPNKIKPSKLPSPPRRPRKVKRIPRRRVGSLRIPPNRIVVKVADHVHGPPSLGNNKIKVDRGPTNNNPSRKNRTRRRPTGVNPNLNGDGPMNSHINGHRGRNPIPFNMNPSTPVSNEGHPNNLEGGGNRPNEQLSHKDRHKTHASHSGV